MKITRIRAGLYHVSTDSGICYSIENRKSPNDWGGQWLWYIAQTAPVEYGFDPVFTKRKALDIIGRIEP